MICRKSDEKSIKLTVETLLAGKVVVIPTDTVYGFSGIVDFTGNYHTDSLIRQIKGREGDKPLIELVSAPSDVFKYSDSKIPEKLLSYWPGPLTLIVKNNEFYRRLTGRETTAFRCPGDLWLRNVIAACNAPVYSTSVNRSGMPVLDEISEIISQFESEVSLIVDDSDRKSALASTLVDVTGKSAVILRQGCLNISL